jgi:outer membrane protein OmpA-like peptidoglycan-associated protein
LNDPSNISFQWYEGNLESSFHTITFLESKIEEIKVSHIKPHGRKVISNVSRYSGDPDKLNKQSFLPDRVLSGVEVFPIESIEYPLDIPRKFNATEVVIIDPIISNVRMVDDKKQGTLNARIYFKLETLDVKKQPEIKSKNDTVTGVSSEDIDLSRRTGCANYFPVVINRSQSPSGVFLPAGCSSVTGGCLAPGLNGGCINPSPVGGCINTLRFGCGSLICLLMLAGLLSMLLRNCDSNSINESDRTDTEIETDESKVDLSPWEIKDEDPEREQIRDSVMKLKTIIVPNVQFYTNSDRLLPSSKENLNTIAMYMLENPTTKAIITGHTDSLGDEDKNQSLSQKRAESVMNYLVKCGVDNRRLSAEGKGESEPAASNSDLEGRLMNRRVEISFYE